MHGKKSVAPVLWEYQIFEGTCEAANFWPFCLCQALSGVDASLKANNDILGNSALQSVLASQFLFQIGIFTAIPMLVNLVLEKGLIKVQMRFPEQMLWACWFEKAEYANTSYLCYAGRKYWFERIIAGYHGLLHHAATTRFSIFYVFLGYSYALFWAYRSPWRCKGNSFPSLRVLNIVNVTQVVYTMQILTLILGLMQYRSTGRGFVVRHINFAENYRLFSRSHFTKAWVVTSCRIVRSRASLHLLCAFSAHFLNS